MSVAATAFLASALRLPLLPATLKLKLTNDEQFPFPSHSCTRQSHNVANANPYGINRWSRSRRGSEEDEEQEARK